MAERRGSDDGEYSSEVGCLRKRRWKRMTGDLEDWMRVYEDVLRIGRVSECYASAMRVFSVVAAIRRL